MTIARCFCLTWLASLTCSALAVEPGANYQHLKHLEQVIGHWKYVGKDEEGNTVHGSETNCWIHNKNYVRVQGLWEPDGSEPVSYELIIGWDAELRQEVMHGMLSTGSTFHRHGNYNKKLNATVSNQVSVAPDGTKNASVCTLAYGKDKNSWSAKWTEATRDGEPVKVAQIKAKRVVEDMTLPKNAKEEFEHMVGIWKLTGQASKGALEGTWCLKWAPGQHCLVGDYSLSVAGKSFRSSDIYAWDSIAEEFILCSAYQGGHIEMSRTKVVKPGVQSGHYTVDIDGKKYEGKIEVRRRGNDKFEVTTTGLAEQGIEDLKLYGVRVQTDNGVSDKKDQASTKGLRSAPGSDKVVSKKEFAEYCAAMTGRWYNTDEKLVDWADFGKFDKSTVSYGVIAPAADGNGLSGDFFAGRGSGKWLTVWNPVTRQIQILSVLSDGTVWEEIRYKRDGKWQTEVTLNHPDGTQEKIQSGLTISKDGNTHSYRGTDATDTGTYHRAVGLQSN